MAFWQLGIVDSSYLNISEMTMDAREVGPGSTTTFTCRMSDLTSAVTVTWLKSDGSTISTGGGYTINTGQLLFQ